MGDRQNYQSQLKYQNIILLGPQGSGKGTQARILAEKYHLQILATGDILRTISQENSPQGQKVKTLIESGQLIDDHELMSVLKTYLEKIDANCGLIFDGIPRTLNQARELDALLSKLSIPQPTALNINISRPTALERLSKRKICSNCQTPYLPADASYQSDICAKCGGRLVIRADDNLEAINKRLDQYYHETEPILDYYRQSDRLIEIDGAPPVPAVSQAIDQAVRNGHD